MSWLRPAEPDAPQPGEHGTPPPARDVVIVPVSRGSNSADEFFSESDLPRVGAPTTPPAAEVEADTRPLTEPSPETVSPRIPDVHEFTSPADSISIADLMDNSVAVDWGEAVAIARLICQRVAPQSGHEYRLDPRHVEITERGDVLVLPGEPGGDPLVKQIGRILRTLLEGSNAPVQLRLLASQASFELPGFDSVEDLSAALSAFEAKGNENPVLAAFKRGREAKYSVSAGLGDRLERRLPVVALPSQPADTAWPSVDALDQKRSPRSLWVVAAIALMFSLAVALVTSHLSERPLDTDASTPQPPRQSPGKPAQPSRIAEVEIVDRYSPSGALPTIPAPEAPIRAGVRPSKATVPRAAAPAVQPVVTAPLQSVPVVDSTDPDRRTAPVPSSAVAGESADSVGMAEVLEDAKAELLATRDYMKAETALRAGDYDQAIADASRLSRMLDAADNDAASASLRAAVTQLLARAASIKRAEEQRVYTIDDEEVTPPIALGRQLPAAAPVGVRRQLVGHLELLINLHGEVETLKLHTPLNRFHERMIVSAAKAWRYQPALRNGKPVRFRLVASINLPES